MCRSGSTRAAQWRVMRYLRNFVVADIVIATQANVHTVTGFIGDLVRVGVLKATRNGYIKRYNMPVDLGPKHPRKMMGGMYDPNSKTKLTKESRGITLQRELKDWEKVLQSAVKKTNRREVSQRLGVSQSTLCRLLKGNYGADTNRMAMRITQTLGEESVCCPVMVGKLVACDGCKHKETICQS